MHLRVCSKVGDDGVSLGVDLRPEVDLVVAGRVVLVVTSSVSSVNHGDVGNISPATVGRSALHRTCIPPLLARSVFQHFIFIFLQIYCKGSVQLLEVTFSSNYTTIFQS